MNRKFSELFRSMHALIFEDCYAGFGPTIKVEYCKGFHRNSVLRSLRRSKWKTDLDSSNSLVSIQFSRYCNMHQHGNHIAMYSTLPKLIFKVTIK